MNASSALSLSLCMVKLTTSCLNGQEASIFDFTTEYTVHTCFFYIRSERFMKFSGRYFQPTKLDLRLKNQIFRFRKKKSTT